MHRNIHYPNLQKVKLGKQEIVINQESAQVTDIERTKDDLQIEGATGDTTAIMTERIGETAIMIEIMIEEIETIATETEIEIEIEIGIQIEETEGIEIQEKGIMIEEIEGVTNLTIGGALIDAEGDQGRLLQEEVLRTDIRQTNKKELFLPKKRPNQTQILQS